MLHQRNSDQRRLNKTGEAIAGAFAGGLSRFIVTPLDVLKIHFQLQIDPKARQAGADVATVAAPASGPRAAGSNGPGLPYYRSLTQASVSILRDGGLKGLWRGTIPATALWISYMGVQFPAYRASQRAATSMLAGSGLSVNSSSGSARTASEPSPLVVSLLAGGASGAAATAVTYPLDWLRTRMAAQAHLPATTRTRPAQIVTAAWQAEGPTAFFRGLVPSLVQVVPSLAVTFAAYEYASAFYDTTTDIVLARAAAWRRATDDTAQTWGSGEGTGPAAGITAAHARADTSSVTSSSDASKAKGSRSVRDQVRSLFAGAAAGVAGKLAVYPLDTVKKRLQMQNKEVAGESTANVGSGASASGPPAGRAVGLASSATAAADVYPYRYKGTVDALISIARQEGVLKGWYKGTVPSLLKAAAAAALTFWSYEGAAAWLRGKEWAVEKD